MSNDEEHLIDLAGKDIDYYTLLSPDLHPSSTEKDITSAYRRTALKHHPDKNPDDASAAARFHELTIAYQILTTPAAKAKHDQTRAAREARKAQTQKYDARRKEMIDELEKGEGVAAGRRSGEEDKAEAEINRIIEDGRRRRMELTEKRRREAAEAAEEAKESSREGSLAVRAVKVRWAPQLLTLDSAALQRKFTQFGSIDGITIRGERKIRLDGEKKRRVLFTAIIVFESQHSAREAIEAVGMKGNEWTGFYAEWAEGKEPEQVQQEPRSERLSAAEMQRFLDFEAKTLERMRAAQELKVKMAAVS
jgi:DnaJ homolog subfamily C member 17